MHTEYASILLDMIVAYERVPHHWLARHGMQFGFNMHLNEQELAAINYAFQDLNVLVL